MMLGLAVRIDKSMSLDAENWVFKEYVGEVPKESIASIPKEHLPELANLTKDEEGFATVGAIKSKWAEITLKADNMPAQEGKKIRKTYRKHFGGDPTVAQVRVLYIQALLTGRVPL